MPWIDVPRYVGFLVWYPIVCVQVVLFAFADHCEEAVKDADQQV